MTADRRFPRVAILALVLGVGCGGGAAGKADGGTGGAGIGTGGASADDAGGGTGAGGNGGGDGTSTWPPATCADPVNGVSTMDFCAYYVQVCTGYVGTGADSYKNLADCMARYADYSANTDPASTPAQNQKGCAAYHLCVAGKSTPADGNHCMHAAGGGANPCSLL